MRFKRIFAYIINGLKKFFTGKCNKKDYVIVASFVVIITLIAVFAKDVNDRFIQSFKDYTYWYNVLNKIVPEPTPIDPGPIGPIDPGPIVIPRNFDVLSVRWSAFWKTLINPEHWELFYQDSLSFLKTTFQVIALPGLGLFIVVFSASKIFYSKMDGTSPDDSSWGAKIDTKIEQKVYIPLKKRISSIWTYITANKLYVFTIYMILFYVTNIFSIFISFTAYYTYVVGSVNFNGIYIQVWRIFVDLSPLFPQWSIPFWIILAYIMWTVFRLWLGKKKIKDLFEQDIKFVKENLGVAIGIVGPQGSGKDFIMVMIQIIKSILFRRQAEENLVQIRLEFRHFPFRKLEMALEKAMKYGQVVNTVSAKHWIRGLISKDIVSFSNKKVDYRFSDWPDMFYNGLVKVSIKKELEDYTRLYYVYFSKQIVGTYPVNLFDYNKSTDQFANWDYQLFENNYDKKLKAIHRTLVIDFNSFRLLKVMNVVNRNPQAALIGRIIPDTGSFFASEYDKERLNQLTNRSRKDNDTRPDNDGTRQMMNILRHLSTIRNDYYLGFSFNLQKLSSLSSTEAYVAETILFLKGERKKFKWSIPLFTVESMILEWLIEAFYKKVEKYIKARNDDTFIYHLILRFAALVSNTYVRLFNNYAYWTVNPELHDVAFDGNYTAGGTEKFHFIPKIVYGNYQTDMLSPIFEKAKLIQKVGINQMEEFKDDYATADDYLAQHGYGTTEMSEAVVNSYLAQYLKEEAERKKKEQEVKDSSKSIEPSTPPSDTDK